MQKRSGNGSAGVERYLTIPELKSGDVLLTNGQRLASEVIGEHVRNESVAYPGARAIIRSLRATDDQGTE